MLKTTLHKNRLLLLFALALAPSLPGQDIAIHWEKPGRTVNTTPTLQVVVNPPLRRGTAIHDRVFSDLEKLGAEYVRYVPWLPYPKLGVAELDPPADGKTSWDFSLIDPLTTDFLNATKGHSSILNFSTIPAWMFVTATPVPYPSDPNQVDWNYTQGTELRDPSMKELSDYYARLVSWYTQGGFTDEFGKRHASGHHFKIPYWEVFNEVEMEHSTTPEQYTARYDAVVSAIRQVSPDTKFVALALAFPSKDPRIFEYFLDPKNHKPGIPLDMISYHFYASPAEDETPEIQQHTFFAQADGFLASVRFIEAIRRHLSPGTRTTCDELGSILPGDGEQKPGNIERPIPDSYWNLSGAIYAYLFGNLIVEGIDVAGESQLVGYPTQFPSVSMVDWNTGAPNARYRVLELLKNNFTLGDRIVDTVARNQYVYALGFMKSDGTHKLLLVNKRDRDIELTLPQTARHLQVVDLTTGSSSVADRAMDTDKLVLHGFGVAVVNF